MTRYNKPHIGSAFNKIIDVIRSCETRDQLKGACRMIRNFHAMYVPEAKKTIRDYKAERLHTLLLQEEAIHQYKVV